MEYYGVRFEHTKELISAHAINEDKVLVVSNSSINYMDKGQPYDEDFFTRNNYEKISRKEFNDFFIEQNKKLNNFIKEL